MRILFLVLSVLFFAGTSTAARAAAVCEKTSCHANLLKALAKDPVLGLLKYDSTRVHHPEDKVILECRFDSGAHGDFDLKSYDLRKIQTRKLGSFSCKYDKTTGYVETAVSGHYCPTHCQNKLISPVPQEVKLELESYRRWHF